MVPHRFIAGFRNRERHAAIAAFDAQAAVGGAAGRLVLNAVFQNVLGEAGGAAGRVNIHAEIRIFTQQRFLPLGQLRCMLFHVLRGDCEERFVVPRVAIIVRLSGVVAAWNGQGLIGVGGDSACRVSGLDGTELGQFASAERLVSHHIGRGYQHAGKQCIS
ncbi:hypothetical protein FQZ97_730280 [compost metagenome]